MQGKELLHKVIIVGDSGVGKTSIINRYVHNFFTKIYKSTIGVDFALKEMVIDEKRVKLQLWDIAGQERYNTLTHIYYRNAVGAIVVFDLSHLESFDHVEYWKKDIDEKVFINDEESEPVPTILLANKVDLLSPKGDKKSQHVQKSISDEELQKYAKEKTFVKWFRTSAKTNEGIDEAMEFLIRQMNANVKRKPKEEIEGYVDITAHNDEEEGSSGGEGGGGTKNPCCN